MARSGGNRGRRRALREWAATSAGCALIAAGCASGGQPADPAGGTDPIAATTFTTSTTAGSRDPSTTVGTVPPDTTEAPAGGSAPERPTSTTTTSTTLPTWWRQVSAEAPLRVWLLGDSLAETAGPALARVAAEAGWLTITTDAVKGSGLARLDLFDWPLAVAEGLVKREVEVAVCLLGANDGQALRVSDRWVPFGTPEWDAEYSRRVGTLMDLLLSRAVRVYWVGVPIMADPVYDERVRHINSIQRAQAETRPGVAFVDGYALFQDDAGGYATHLPDEQGETMEVRLPDGVHFTTAGADRLAGFVAGVMAAEWRPSDG